MLATLLLLPLATMIDPPRSFHLGPDAAPTGETLVAPDRRYRAGDFGYEPNSAPGTPLFSVALPEGNWRVTLTLGGATAGETSVKAESRRLMLDRVRTRARETVTRSFVVNVRTPELPAPPENAPGGAAVRLNPREAGSYSWDDRLTLEFLGQPRVQSVRIAPAADVPTVYLVGDSTVTDQHFEPAASWGQMLPAFLDDRVAVANHAESGETLKSFLTGLRLDKALSTMKPGDYLFIQFGHNDQKAQWPQTYAAADSTYPSYLRAYVAEARRRGATPVLVTSPERRNFDRQGRIVPSLGRYPDAVRLVAAEEGLPLIDLNRASIALYEALGPQQAPRAFNERGADKTHHNNYGAWLLARALAGELRTAVPALAPHVTAGPFDPAHPPLPGEVELTPSTAASANRPAGS